MADTKNSTDCDLLVVAEVRPIDMNSNAATDNIAKEGVVVGARIRSDPPARLEDLEEHVTAPVTNERTPVRIIKNVASAKGSPLARNIVGRTHGLAPDYKDQTRSLFVDSAPPATEDQVVVRIAQDQVRLVPDDTYLSAQDHLNEAPTSSLDDEEVSQQRQHQSRDNESELNKAASGSALPKEGQSTAVNARRRTILASLVVLVLIVAVVGGVCGSGNCGSSSSTVAGESPTSRAEYIKDFVTSISGQDIHYPVQSGATASPEDMAVKWLIESDPLQLTPSTDPQRLVQRYALLNLWYHTTSPPGNTGTWDNSTGWLMAESECDWFGITCGGDTRVSKISVSANNLKGELPEDLGLLTTLTTLISDVNSLSGTLPLSIGKMTLLDLLDISTQALSGPLPNEWSGLTNLKTRFSVGVNRLTGTLPDWIGHLTHLEAFRVDTNRFSGTIPDSIANWDRIKQAWFFDNNFKGTIPFCSSNFAGNLTDISLRVDCDICPCCESAVNCCPGADFC